MAPGRCIAIVGAESTGKTTLAAALAERLRAQGLGRVAWVPELLRDWCQSQGRTPLAHEQGPILRAQHERIEAARAHHDWVVCDTTALMTAVYSTLIFGDDSLQARAAELHARSMAITLLTAIDLPWVADGLQRDGPQVQAPVDALLRQLMRHHGIAFAEVSGQGEPRVQRALETVAAAMAFATPASAAASAGTPLNASQAAPHTPNRVRWRCACCAQSPAPLPLPQP